MSADMDPAEWPGWVEATSYPENVEVAEPGDPLVIIPNWPLPK